MPSDVLAFFATVLVMGGVPWLTGFIAARRGVRDRRTVVMIAFALVFIVFGVVFLTLGRWGWGIYGVVLGSTQLYLARWLRRTRLAADSATPAAKLS
jgi:hypothetical protein